MAANKVCEQCGRAYIASGNRQRRCHYCRTASPLFNPRFVRPVFAPRPCELCGVAYTPGAWHARWCSRCRPFARQAVDRALYGSRSGHKEARAAVAPVVESGCALCVRCGQPIVPGSRWDLDHGDSGIPGRYEGPAHASCNRAAPMRNRAQRRRSVELDPERRSREW